jgi:endonuclease YncB( thermonuclease family)
MTRPEEHERVGSRARRRVAGAVPVVLLAGLLPLATPTASAIDPQPERTWETGIVTGVADGDTITVAVTSAVQPATIAPPLSADPAVPNPRTYCTDRLDADGTMPDDGKLDGCRVRLIGLQAPEEAHGAGSLDQCRASAATAVLSAQLPKGTRVQLRAIAVTSRDDRYSGGRLVRTVYRQDANGQWVDVGRALAASGTVMWFPLHVGDADKPEYVHNLAYRQLIDEAAAARRGMWSANLCGPSRPATVRTWVVSDPIGDDANAEHLVLANDAAAPLDVSGWTVRDSSLATYTLPTPTVIPARDHLRVFAGRGTPGTPTARDLHMGGASAVFTNFDAGAGYFHGDGAYVFDAQPGYAYGNLRAWFHYPCAGTQCTRDPLAGRLRLGTISYDPPGADTAAGEYVDVVNASAAPVALGGYGLTRQGSQVPFPPNAVLPAGATLRVSMGVGVDDASRIHLGRTASLLANAGDVVTVANLNGAVLDCRAWGTRTCSGMPVAGPLQQPSGEASPQPVATAPAARPGAPRAVTATASSRRIVVRWAPPAEPGTSAVTRYRARVAKQVGASTKHRTTCKATAAKRTCRTGKLTRGATYVVTVQARNRTGYGPAAPPIVVRIR